MVADTYSARIGFIKQGTGNNNNSWGDTFNASVTDLLDRVLAGTDSHAVTGGTLDLSAGTLPPAGPSPVAAGIQAFTGTLTADQTVIFPSLGGRWTIFNNTTGGFSLLLKTSGMATPIQIPVNAFVQIVCDGTTLYRLDRNKIGSVMFHAAYAPAGALEMDGSSLLRASYPDLFTAIGTTYGSVDGTHFTLPNLKDTGRYVRSRTNSLTVGTYQSGQNASHTHTFSSITDSTSIPHNHTFTATSGTESQQHSHSSGTGSLVNGTASSSTGGGAFGFSYPNSFGGSTSQESAQHTHTVSGTTNGMDANVSHQHTFTGTTAASGGTEARPESVAMIACILY